MSTSQKDKKKQLFSNINGTVLSNRKIFGKEGPPFEVDRFFRLDRSDRKLLFHSKHFHPKLGGTVQSNRAGVTNRKISRFTVPLDTGNFRRFKPEFLVEWKAPLFSHFVYFPVFDV